RAWICVCVMALLATAQGQTNSILGNWTNPTGSTIHIYRCGSRICADVVGISRSAPTRVDADNPDPALRGRSLCGLKIGSDFELVNPSRARDGRLYDPETGKTYTGSMTREGDKLKLRGYVGIPLFGRTETWSRGPEKVTACRS
ncbi:MAG: DUF2147 domain-containing protein, partial [Acidobacteriaceae bacterium]